MSSTFQKLKDKIIVIKFGGNALTEQTAKSFSQSINQLAQAGVKPVIVHGGGPQINVLLEKLNITSHFIDGMRYTDAPTMTVAEMVLSGQVNKILVQSLNQTGLLAVGISGKDGQTLTAKKKTTDDKQQTIDLGLVGDIQCVRPTLIQTLLTHNFIPVIAPIASSEMGETLNINADYAASAIAKSLSAHSFILMTNISGLVDNTQTPIRTANVSEIQRLIEQGVIAGGMIPKTLSAIDALTTVTEVKIIDGRQADSLLNCLADKLPDSKNITVGTTISAIN